MPLINQKGGGASASPPSKGKDMAKKEAKIVDVCGYQKGPDGGVLAKVFQLKEGEKLPSGWNDTPAKIKPAKSKADK